jgi:predicted nuclease with RNAse H fold
MPIMLTLIGIDAAAQRTKTGYAIASWEGSSALIERSGVMDHRGAAMAVLVDALRAGTCLIAIDAPLGWPLGLREALADHLAGQALSRLPDAMFSRASDRRLRELGHRPLEVGAALIARAAHGALFLLQELREASGQKLPLLWDPTVTTSGVIEVYPAATLKMHGHRSTGYKHPEQVNERREIAAALEPTIIGIAERSERGADEFDACLCLLAALDFLDGECVAPQPAELDVAQREGWIWLRK